MNVQSILERIERDAKEAAANTLEQARLRADEMRAGTLDAMDKIRVQTLVNAREQATEIARRMRVMAGLDARKEDLLNKRLLLDEAFDMALSQMDAMPQEKARAHGQKILLLLCEGAEKVIPSDKSPWCDAAFISEANAELEKAGRPAGLTLHAAAKMPSGGFVLQTDGMELNCTYRAILDIERSGLEADVASRLF